MSSNSAPREKISFWVIGSILIANKGAPLLLQNKGARGQLPPLLPPLYTALDTVLFSLIGIENYQ